jgi:hypothetical protein
MKVSTASFAAQICITAYLLFELMAFRTDSTLRAIQQTIKLGIYALVIPLLVLSLDHFGNFSGWSYCQFYASWDPMKREIVPGLRPILVGAGYGAWIGFIVMWVVGGYLAAIEAMRRRKSALG